VNKLFYFSEDRKRQNFERNFAVFSKIILDIHRHQLMHRRAGAGASRPYGGVLWGIGVMVRCAVRHGMWGWGLVVVAGLKPATTARRLSGNGAFLPTFRPVRDEIRMGIDCWLLRLSADASSLSLRCHPERSEAKSKDLLTFAPAVFAGVAF
jgi:hypothetical protein